jgi:membrane-associated phospholipid phosphatase
VSLFDRALLIAITVVLIVGGYQFYFWAQRRRWFRARTLETRWDARVSYDPRWVWVYSGLYYPMIVLAALSVPSWDAYARAVGCFLALLAVQVTIFLLLPVEIPPHWRTQWRGAWEGTWSQRFLDLVWSYDKLRNSMPSMHVSVATMVDLTIWAHWPTVGAIGGAFPLLIAISALRTKQHYVVDVVPGAAMGAAVFFAWRHLVPPI